MSAEMSVPFVDLGVVHQPVREQLLAAFEQALTDSAFIGGAALDAFEQELADHVGAAQAVGVASGTAALQLTLLAAGIGPGDEVILPPNTFFATAEAIIATGATPVFADVDVATALIDPDAVEAAITPRTVAIAAVHLYGQAVDMTRASDIAGRHGLFLLEDAAQAIGASWRGQPVGSLGDAAAVSFYPGKNLGALGDAGAVTTNDPTLATKVRWYRSHGEDGRHHHVVSGFTERLDGIQAAFLRIKLAQLDEAQKLRDRAVDQYRALLRDVDGVGLLDIRPDGRHVHHLMVVRVSDRDRTVAELQRRGVGAAVHYPTPIHLQPACAHLATAGDFPHAEELSASILSLPLYAGITEAQVAHCAETLADIVSAR